MVSIIINDPMMVIVGKGGTDRVNVVGHGAYYLSVLVSVEESHGEQGQTVVQVFSDIEGDPLTDLDHGAGLYHRHNSGQGVADEHQPCHNGDGAEIYYAAFRVDGVDCLSRQLGAHEGQQVGKYHHASHGDKGGSHLLQVAPQSDYYVLFSCRRQLFGGVVIGILFPSRVHASVHFRTIPFGYLLR